MELIFVAVILLAAVGFLVKKFFFKKKDCDKCA